ncbi:NADH:flavin oxidoreductase/NADH oxidase family protein [Sphingorhabdus sp. Alg239-R122]|uniref:NADH:flavin oxidoreductase/NADH oxidase family protein n=1 Tax=Sphingorhabdus sp. Alg239-R122 TaxID=2305989 RepID=UPI0013DBB7A3|nr:NADH:flavin oxidoreductase/NADH oxidase family protein [Sphingorhabdus sp. Alg239-R122]
MPSNLQSRLKLPCGSALKNRIAKAAMTEGLADARGVPTEALEKLYALWSDGGAGTLITGNIIIDRDHLERPGNVIIHGEPDAGLAAALKSWAKTATQNGNALWAQLSHGGRQVMKIVNPNPKAPSPVQLGLPGGQFGEPVALTGEEIEELVERFAIAAGAVKKAGFTGVQVHAAHGYLLSSFLNPRANQRDDEYGGSLENRARMLMATVAAVRKKVGAKFPIAVKLNSADFQRGGFAFEDSLQVAEWLERAGVDLIEISGGNYEQPKLLGIEGIEEEAQQNVAPSTAAREAYFVDFALAMQEKVQIPLMVTGGFRSREAMDYALSRGAADVIGIGRPMCTMPDAPKQIFAGLDRLPAHENELQFIPDWLGFLKRIQALKALDGFAVQYWYYGQLYALAEKGRKNEKLTPFKGFREVEMRNRALMKARRAG